MATTIGAAITIGVPTIMRHGTGRVRIAPNRRRRRMGHAISISVDAMAIPVRAGRSVRHARCHLLRHHPLRHRRRIVTMTIRDRSADVTTVNIQAGRNYPGPLSYREFLFQHLRDCGNLRDRLKRVSGLSGPPLSDADVTGGRLPFEVPDFRAIFEKSPGLYLILDAKFTIVAVSDSYCRATMTDRDDIMGRGLFEVFPDNPDDNGADGVANLRTSLLNVIKKRAADRMADQKYDIRRPDGVFEERYWRPLNSPVLGVDGYVRWIVHAVEDVTELVLMRKEEAEARRRVREQERNAADLRHTNGELVEKIALLRASLKQLSSM